TTHYTFTIDGSKAYPGVGASAQVPAEAWLDNDGRLRRMRLSANVGQLVPGSAGPNIAFTVNMELFEFGTQVKVTPPPADQVVESSGASLGSLGSLGFSGFGNP